MRKTAEEVKTKYADEIGTWTDIEKDGKRLDKVIRRLDKKARHCTTIDQLIKLSNAIAFVTGKKLEIADKVLRLTDLLKKLEKKTH